MEICAIPVYIGTVDGTQCMKNRQLAPHLAQPTAVNQIPLHQTMQGKPWGCMNPLPSLIPTQPVRPNPFNLATKGKGREDKSSKPKAVPITLLQKREEKPVSPPNRKAKVFGLSEDSAGEEMYHRSPRSKPSPAPSLLITKVDTDHTNMEQEGYNPAQDILLSKESYILTKYGMNHEAQKMQLHQDIFKHANDLLKCMRNKNLMDKECGDVYLGVLTSLSMSYRKWRDLTCSSTPTPQLNLC